MGRCRPGTSTARSRVYSDQFVYDDRRRLSGDPIEGAGGLRTATERILEQYSVFEGRTLAVRGECLQLSWSRWSDDAGNETRYLHVFELGDDGRIAYAGRFDEDDFEGAYRELERRYYAREGAAFADAGAAATDSIVAVNQGDFDRLFGVLSTPEMRVENRSRSAFPDRSASDLRASFGELNAMVASSRTWLSAACWVSRAWAVTRLEREAVGGDGEEYAWTRLLAIEIRDGRLASMCEFELENEEQAFAYAEERVRAASSRLAVTNRASDTLDSVYNAMRADDVDAAAGFYRDRFTYDDRRSRTGNPIEDLAQYSRFETRTLAVRGERLQLAWSRWSDDAGNETTHLQVIEVGDDERITFEGRFDEDDFEGAYGGLERRYYAGEGAAFAEGGATVTDYAIAMNRSEFDRVFGELTCADFRLENRSRSGFGDRSAAELRATYEDLTAMVASARMWHSALCWLSPTLVVGRFERDAVGRDGERYAWTLIDVGEIRDGRLALVCEFELDDEEEAFAYAEERMRAADARPHPQS